MARIGTTMDVIVSLKIIQCASCAIPFGVPEDLDKRRLADGKKFYCPQGHENFYGGETMDVLRKKITDLESRLKQATIPPVIPKVDIPAPATARERVLGLVKAAEGRPVTVGYAVTVLKVHKTTADRALKSLSASKLLRKTSEGYVLAESPA